MVSGDSPRLLEHMWIGDYASWITKHDLCCKNRLIMELYVTSRMNNLKRHVLGAFSGDRT
jgi:hypothetical protein